MLIVFNATCANFEGINPLQMKAIEGNLEHTLKQTIIETIST